MHVERIVQRHCVDCGPENMQGKQVRALNGTVVLVGLHAVLGDSVGFVRTSFKDELVEAPIIE